MSSAPAGTPNSLATAATVVIPGVSTSSGSGSEGRELDRLRLRAGDLDVRRVSGRQRDLVLTGGTRRHVLVRADTAHHADVRGHPVPLQPDPVEDAVVGGDEALVARLEALAIAVERVGVLHDELARAQHRRPRARLVALLGLEVVDELRAGRGRSARCSPCGT